MVYVHLDAELYSWLLWKNKKSEVRTFFGSQNSKRFSFLVTLILNQRLVEVFQCLLNLIFSVP